MIEQMIFLIAHSIFRMHCTLVMMHSLSPPSLIAIAFFGYQCCFVQYLNMPMSAIIETENRRNISQ